MAIAQLLLEQGEGIEISAITHPDYGGDTPLHIAAERGHWPLVTYLLSTEQSRPTGTLLNVRNVKGRSPVHMPIVSGKR